ncbi:MAG: hypothetical protein MUF71_03120 [Candidatus Kapabacteria bacterium]|nr:hypothetical protein [Candidatus Kapabacteria bacterium]
MDILVCAINAVRRNSTEQPSSRSTDILVCATNAARRKQQKTSQVRPTQDYTLRVWMAQTFERGAQSMLRWKTVLLFVFIGSVCLSACSKAWTNEDEQFVQTYTEILIAREQFASDSMQANKRVQEIFRRYGMSEIAFRQRFSELTGNPEKLRQLLDTARNRARRIGEEEGAKENAERERKKADSLKTASPKADSLKRDSLKGDSLKAAPQVPRKDSRQPEIR